jgi:hypothetical protein
MKYLLWIAFQLAAGLVHLCSWVESTEDREAQRRMTHRDREAFRRYLYQTDIP